MFNYRILSRLFKKNTTVKCLNAISALQVGIIKYFRTKNNYLC